MTTLSNVEQQKIREGLKTVRNGTAPTIARLRKMGKLRESICIVEIDGEEIMRVRSVYNTAKIDGRFEDIISGLKNSHTPSADVARAIAMVLVEWDLKEEESDPEPVPITVERLMQVPSLIIWPVVNGLWEDQAPNAESSPA